MPKIFIGGDLLNTVTTDDFFDSSMKEVIGEADFAVCNFEAPVQSSGNPIEKAGAVKEQNAETVSILKNAGFDLFLMANNHIYDYGLEGLRRTFNEMRNYSIASTGAGVTFKDAYTPLIKNIKGIKFGFINAAEAQFGQIVAEEEKEGGYAWINHPQINQLVGKLKNEVDVLIFFAHAGLEHYEVPLPEWRRRYHELCDLGADCVVAAHPHIPQGYEFYKGKPVFYSLGNFFFPKPKDKEREIFGFSLMLNVKQPGDYEIDMIYTKCFDNKLTRILPNETPISFEKLNRLLMPENHPELAKETYLHAYNAICLKYFSSVFQSVNRHDNFFKALKKLWRQVLRWGKLNKSHELLLLHLLRNETYQYVTKNALQIKTGDNRKIKS